MSDDEKWRTEFERLKTRATEECPDEGWAWFEFGEFLQDECDNPNLAVRAFERAQELLADEDLRLQLGNAYVDNGDIAKGLALMRASAAESPRTEAYCYLSGTYRRTGKYAEAEVAARSAIRLEPSFEEAFYLLGESLKHRDKAAAIDAYRTAVSLDINYALAWQALGTQLIADIDVNEGVDALERSVNLDPEDVWSRVYLANGLWRLGRLNEAEDQYLAAIALAPDYEDLRKWHEQFLKSTSENR